MDDADRAKEVEQMPIDLAIAAAFLKGTRQMQAGILALARAIFTPRPGDALGRIQQAFAAGIVPCPGDERADCVSNLVRDGGFVVEISHFCPLGARARIAHTA